jgi:hypothetical protein
LTATPSATPLGWLECRAAIIAWSLDEAQDLPAEARAALAAALNQWNVPGGDYVVGAAAALLPVADDLSDAGKARLIEALECIAACGWAGLLGARIGEAVDAAAEAQALRDALET